MITCNVHISSHAVVTVEPGLNSRCTTVAFDLDRDGMSEAVLYLHSREAVERLRDALTARISAWTLDRDAAAEIPAAA